jgi:hypothetical protein
MSDSPPGATDLAIARNICRHDQNRETTLQRSACLLLLRPLDGYWMIERRVSARYSYLARAPANKTNSQLSLEIGQNPRTEAV